MSRLVRPLLAAALTALLVASAAPATAAPRSSAVSTLDLAVTVESVDTASDGTFRVNGSVHLPVGSPTALVENRVTVQGVGSDGTFLGAVSTAYLQRVWARSELPGYTVRYPFTAFGVTLEPRYQSPVVVGIDAPAPYRLSVPDGQRGNVLVDAVGLSARAVGDTIRVAHHRGTSECTPTRLRVTTGTTTREQDWAPRRSGGDCVGEIPVPQIDGLTRVGLQLMAPGEGAVVWVPVTVLPARTVDVGRSITTTRETVTVTSSPRAATTVLQRWTPNGWVTAQTATSHPATFTIPRTAEEVRYRIRVPRDTARAFEGADFLVLAP